MSAKFNQELDSGYKGAVFRSSNFPLRVLANISQWCDTEGAMCIDDPGEDANLAVNNVSLTLHSAPSCVPLHCYTKLIMIRASAGLSTGTCSIPHR